MQSYRFNELVRNLKIKIKKYHIQSYILLISVILFMTFMLLMHKSIFLEFGFILFLLALYTIWKFMSLNDELVIIDNLKKEAVTSKFQKVYKEGHHMIANPTNAALDLGGYVYVGKDERGTKIYQNITDVVVLGRINPNGEVVYDDFGIPAYLINNLK